MKYKIRHEETLVDFFWVEANSECEAITEFEHLVSEGKIDFSNMEMITSSNKVYFPPIQVGDICYYPEVPDQLFIVTRIYYDTDGMGSLEQFFDSVYLKDGMVFKDGSLSLIRPNGKHVDFSEIFKSL